jgi:oligo-1,6-glucosidase
VNPNYKRVNVAKEEKDSQSILNFYRKCLSLRKSTDTLIYGDYKEYFPKDKNIYMYERSLNGESYLIICSFSRLPVKVHKPEKFVGQRGKLMLCNYPTLSSTKTRTMRGYFRPYETRIYRYTL